MYKSKPRVSALPANAATPIIGAMTLLSSLTSSAMKTSLLLLAFAIPLAAQASEETEGTASAAAPSFDMAELYNVERSSAGNLPLDSKLRQLLPADTVVLTMEIGEQRFHALRQEADREEPVGGLLLVPDPAIGTVWVQQVEALRFDLAQKGWLTLAMEPPQPDEQPLPERTLPVMQSFASGAASAAEPVANEAEETNTGNNVSDEQPEAPLAPFAERFAERMDLALEQLTADSLEPVVVIAFGRATPWVMDYLNQQAEQRLSLVMIDPIPDQSADAPLFTTLWAGLDETRIVDIYHSPLPGYPQAAPDARIRKGQARREGLPNYLQVRAAGPFTGWHDEMPWLTAKVRGLIQTGILTPIAEEKEKEQQEAQAAQTQNPPGMPRN